MKLTLREMILAWLTGVVLLFMPTWFFFISPRMDDAKAKRDLRDERAGDLEKEQGMLAQREAWNTRLTEAIKGLPSYQETQDVTADMLIKVEQMAVSNNLVLTRRDPQRERRHGDMGSLDIKCNWEGNLDSLVHFLFALQQDRGMLDISQLYIKSESKGLLKGTFTINCSYVRLKTASGGAEAPKGTPAAEAGNP